MTYYFDNKLYEKAIELLDKTNDLADIAKDVKRIKNVVEFCTPYTLQQMTALDKEIKDKYPEIKVFQNLADSIKWKQPSIIGNSKATIEEVERLKFDCYYLLALALKRSGEIVELSEFFDEAYFYNE